MGSALTAGRTGVGHKELVFRIILDVHRRGSAKIPRYGRGTLRFGKAISCSHSMFRSFTSSENGAARSPFASSKRLILMRLRSSPTFSVSNVRQHPGSLSMAATPTIVHDVLTVSRFSVGLALDE